MQHLQVLAQREPWRQNHGQPNALDPTWEGVDRELCGGNIEHEVTVAGGATGWWHCQSCGYVGHGQHTAHRVVQHPLDYFAHSVLFYLRRRTLQGAPVREASMQAFFAAGAALRYAATLPPDRLGPYVRDHVMLKA